MSDEDEADCEELPPITVNCAARDTRRFAIPPAGEVASQRARAQRCEAELQRLVQLATRPAHSDSSGSEGEAALAASVTALRVCAARRLAPPPLHKLLRAAAPHLPPHGLVAAYARAAPPAPAVHLAASALKRLARVAPWPSERGKVLECAVWLCLAQCAAELRALGAPRVARAAHALLEEAQDGAAGVLQGALGAPRARLRLADALRGADARSAALADTLETGALAELDAAGARAPAELCTRLQLEGRARARGAPAPAPTPALPLEGGARAREAHPDSLQVLAATTKLQMLFPAAGHG